mgnify:CR=1 FL=1
MITLEKYNVKFVDDFVEFVKEFQKYGDEFDMIGIFETAMECRGINKKYLELSESEIREFFPKYVEFILNCENYDTIEKKDWVEADSYFICNDGKMIGEIRFRKRLNKYLLTRSQGHIGYAIKHSERSKGYGNLALKLILNKIWNEEKHTELMISCKENNKPSSKLIEKNGGILNRINIECDVPTKEYWFFKPIR